MVLWLQNLFVATSKKRLSTTDRTLDYLKLPSFGTILGKLFNRTPDVFFAVAVWLESSHRGASRSQGSLGSERNPNDQITIRSRWC